MVIAPFGTWSSPVGVEALTAPDVLSLAEPRFDGADLYWVEGRPAEAGRVTLLRLRDGRPSELTPGINVRTRVHEYGGGAWDARDGVVVVSEFRSGRLHRADLPGLPAITPESGHWRFADLRVHPGRGLVLAVREDHSGPGRPVNTLVALRLDGVNADGGTVLVSGADFYACPALSDDGRLAWVEWDQPNMPWDATRLFGGTLAEGRVAGVRLIAGGPEESAVHPCWDGERLLFVSDRTGFANLWAATADGIEQLSALQADLADPMWVFGERPYAPLGDGRVLVRPRVDGISRPRLLDRGELTDLGLDAVDTRTVSVAGDRAAALVEFADRPAAIVRWSLAEGPASPAVVRSAASRTLPPAWVSRAEAVSWSGPQGPVHGWFFAPSSQDQVAPAGELPPLIVIGHGGPTGFSTCGFSLGVQFWTTRGFAVLLVNYGGSSGYGRAYRERLTRQWGIVDVRDCIDGALAMAGRGRVDRARLVIKGGSAGGYTALRALTTSEVFAAGVVLYGIGDLAALTSDTHKFEARYLDSLVGEWPADAAVYAERSPINHLDALNAPMLLLQGAEDRVVPPEQARRMADAVAAKGLPVTLIVFDGEGHGFRGAAAIQAAVGAELEFYRRVFALAPQ